MCIVYTYGVYVHHRYHDIPAIYFGLMRLEPVSYSRYLENISLYLTLKAKNHPPIPQTLERTWGNTDIQSCKNRHCKHSRPRQKHSRSKTTELKWPPPAWLIKGLRQNYVNHQPCSLWYSHNGLARHYISH
jgi:hypothetical protein